MMMMRSWTEMTRTWSISEKHGKTNLNGGPCSKLNIYHCLLPARKAVHHNLFMPYLEAGAQSSVVLIISIATRQRAHPPNAQWQ